MGFLLTLGVLAAAIYFISRANIAYGFHYRGKGERKGKAVYARLCRESPNSADASLSEAEFVDKFIQRGPRVWLNMILGLVFGILFVVVGLGAAVFSAAR